MYGMKKGILVFLLSFCAFANSFAVNNYTPKKFTTVTSHGDVYPYVLNNAKTGTNAKNISASAATARRAVVPRTNSSARATTVNTTPIIAAPTTNIQPARRVVEREKTTARSATNVRPTTMVARGTTPTQIRTINNARTTTTTSTTNNGNVSSQRCFADYKECMEGYCQREDTPYNRCYCSAKLAQIDAKYQDKIDKLIQQIIRLQYTSSVTSDEIKEYWDNTVGVYTHDNPWTNIDNALNIEWADTQSRVRGQNAFNTGHEYCVQHLRSCYYMASNMRDAYKSEIARDCASYEKSLQKIQDAAESVIESYQW